MRMLPRESFEHVFAPLRGKRIGYVRPVGNVGDMLLERATVQMFEEFGIDWRMFNVDEPDRDVDELVFGGGGNMGTLWQINHDLRGHCRAFGIPMTILPQSFSSREDEGYHRVFVREHRSLAYCDDAQLAPDLALGLDYSNAAAPSRRQGVFLRRDRERVVRRGWHWFARDPVHICRTTDSYLRLAAKYERIITDRLHFAISGLIVGRDVTLLPNSYHKNLGVYESWLRDLGCGFAESVDRALEGPTSRAA